MSEQNKEKKVVVLTLEEKKAKIVGLKAEVFDIMGVGEGLQRELQQLQQKKMQIINEINKLKAEIRKEGDSEVIE